MYVKFKFMKEIGIKVSFYSMNKNQNKLALKTNN